MLSELWIDVSSWIIRDRANWQVKNMALLVINRSGKNGAF